LSVLPDERGRAVVWVPRAWLGKQWATNLLLTYSKTGQILELIPDVPEKEAAQRDARLLDGVLTPGWINAHTHLELSALGPRELDAFAQAPGMAGFGQQLVQERLAIQPKVLLGSARQAALVAAQQGVAAFGDIANSDLPAQLTAPDLPARTTFVELLGLDRTRAQQAWNLAQENIKRIQQAEVGPTHLTLHAPYSCHPWLRQQVYRAASKPGARLSVHLLESLEERQLFTQGTGPLAKWFLGLGWPLPPAQDPLAYLLQGLPQHTPVLWVHLTQATAQDLQRLRNHSREAAFVLCPRSNRLLHNQLPPVHLFQENDRVCLGTDSLASCPDLDIFPEMKLLNQELGAPLSELFKWATANGAEALGYGERLGQLKVGTRPRLLHLSPLSGDRLLPETQVEVLA